MCKESSKFLSNVASEKKCCCVERFISSKKNKVKLKYHPHGGKGTQVSTKMHVWVEVFVNGECVFLLPSRTKRRKVNKVRIKKNAPFVAPDVASDSWSLAWVEATSCLIPFAMLCVAALMSVSMKRSCIISNFNETSIKELTAKQKASSSYFSI